MTKLTKKEKFAMLKAIPAVAENPMLVEFIDHEVELLNKRTLLKRSLLQIRLLTKQSKQRFSVPWNLTSCIPALTLLRKWKCATV